MIEKWKTLESRYLFRRPWLTARVDRVQLPDGRVNPEHYVLEYPDWVNVIAITASGDYVFIKQYRHALADVFTELCAGVMEPGETPEQAARRELLEETGYGGGQWHELMTIAQNPSTCNNMTHCFIATGVARVDSQHLDGGEDIEVVLLGAEQVVELLQHDMMKQALMAAPLWRHLYEARNI